MDKAQFLANYVSTYELIDIPEWVEGLMKAIEENRFEWIKKDEKHIGFYSWLLVNKGGDKYLYIGNAFIEPKFRSLSNLKKLREELLERFKDVKQIYWKRIKNDKYTFK